MEDINVILYTVGCNLVEQNHPPVLITVFQYVLQRRKKCCCVLGGACIEKRVVAGEAHAMMAGNDTTNPHKT